MKNSRTPNKIRETIERLVRWFRYDDQGCVTEEFDEPPSEEENDDFEFSYDQILEEEYGIDVQQGGVRINIAEFLLAVEKHKEKLQNPKYDKIFIDIVFDNDGYFEDASIIGEREETEEDIRERELAKQKELEEKNRLKEAKRKEREQKKLEKLREELKKYEDKL